MINVILAGLCVCLLTMAVATWMSPTAAAHVALRLQMRSNALRASRKLYRAVERNTQRRAA